MKELLALLALSFLFCSNGFPVNSLSDGKKGTIKFEQQNVGAKIIIKFPKNVD